MRFNFILAAVALASCSTGSDMMDRAVDSHGQTVEEIRAESGAHAAALAGAQNMDDVSRAEADHRHSMNGAMDHMRDAMDQARSSGASCAMGGGRMMRDLSAEMEEHQSRMSAAIDMDAAREEEARHQSWMTEELGYIDEDHDGMRMMMNMCGGC